MTERALAMKEVEERSEDPFVELQENTKIK
jgi:hypothetical protein